MSDRVMNRPLPEVELIDMRREFQETARSSFFPARWSSRRRKRSTAANRR